MKGFRGLYSVNIYLPHTANRNMNIHHKVAAGYGLIGTPQRLFLIASAYIVRKETMELFRTTVQWREEFPHMN